MIFGRKSVTAGKDGSNKDMEEETQRASDLRHMKRLDLVELLVSDMDVIEGLRSSVSDMQAKLDEAQDAIRELNKKLDERDARIEHLMEMLKTKDETIGRLAEGRTKRGMVGRRSKMTLEPMQPGAEKEA